jgi:hypothetical protein
MINGCSSVCKAGCSIQEAARTFSAQGKMNRAQRRTKACTLVGSTEIWGLRHPTVFMDFRLRICCQAALGNIEITPARQTTPGLAMTLTRHTLGGLESKLLSLQGAKRRSNLLFGDKSLRGNGKHSFTFDRPPGFLHLIYRHEQS